MLESCSVKKRRLSSMKKTIHSLMTTRANRMFEAKVPETLVKY